MPVGVDAIMGVTFFGDEAPEDFGKFDQACITLFRVTSGGAWVDAIAINSAGGINHKGALFLVTYIFVVNWTLLQVSVAVLLDRFISSSVEMQAEKRALKEAELVSRKHGRTALDPLIKILVKSAVDDADLSTRIQALFQVAFHEGWLAITTPPQSGTFDVPPQFRCSTQ